MSRTFLTFNSYAAAQDADAKVCLYLRDTYHGSYNQWSGVSTNGTLYGIDWASEVQAVYGDPSTNPSLVLVDEVVDADGKGDWYLYAPPPPPPDNP